MKKLVTFALLCMLSAALLAGCGGGAKNAQNSENPQSAAATGKTLADIDLSAFPPDAAAAIKNGIAAGTSVALPENWDTMSQDEKNAWALQLVMNAEWPAANLPADLPAYSAGKTVNSGGAANDFYVIIEGTKANIDAYLTNIKNAGYTVDTANGSAKKGGVTIEFSDRGEGTWQMNIFTQAAGNWPENIPAFITKPQGKQLVGEPYLNDMGSLVNLSIDVGMTEQEGKAWLDAMAQTWENGSAGDTQWSGQVKHNNKTWDITAEIYEASGGVFSVQFTWSEQ